MTADSTETGRLAGSIPPARLSKPEVESARRLSLSKPEDADTGGFSPSKPEVESARRLSLSKPEGGVRRGPFRVGDRVQLTDSRGRMNTITLQAKGSFHSHKGRFDHEQLLGQPEGIVITNTEGVEYLALRPLLSDYVLSMPRGAQVIYPKDAGQIVAMADIFPGARVIEAGVGSGGLTLALLRAIGESGELHSIEIRPEFAEVARGNVRTFFGETPDTWRVHLGAFADVANKDFEPSSVDRVVLDMLAPWENLAAAARVLTPGGVFCAYVATTTQLSRLAEDLRVSQCFTEPVAFETMVRTWHLEGLAVRPDHRMIGHTGFLLIARRMAVGVKPPLRRRRPAKGAYPVAADAVAAEAVAAEAGEAAGPGVAGEPGAASGTFSIAASPISADLFSAEFTEDAMEVRPVAERKLRRVLRELGGSDES